MIANHSISDTRFVFPSLEQFLDVLFLEEYNTRVVVLGVMALGAAAVVMSSFWELPPKGVRPTGRPEAN